VRDVHDHPGGMCAAMSSASLPCRLSLTPRALEVLLDTAEELAITQTSYRLVYVTAGSHISRRTCAPTP
jgi:hypothetical protein